MEWDYFNYKSNNKVKKGSVLISEPFMKDPFFVRSVILICEHNDEGSFGYKLNSPCNKANMKLLDNDILENLHFGGPVENEYLNFIHNCENPKINSNKIKNLYCIPGNAGTGEICKNINIDILNFELLYKELSKNDIRIVIMGPEIPLVQGITDFFENKMEMFCFALPSKQKFVFFKKNLQKNIV